VRHYGDAAALCGKTVTLWGLAFKPDTDDMREAPSRTLLEQLWQANISVRAYDPEALHEARRIYGERHDLVLCSNADDAIEGAEALVIITEWKSFRSPDFSHLANSLGGSVIFDAVTCIRPPRWNRQGWSITASDAVAHCTRRGVKTWLAGRCGVTRRLDVRLFRSESPVATPERSRLFGGAPIPLVYRADNLSQGQSGKCAALQER